MKLILLHEQLKGKNKMTMYKQLIPSSEILQEGKQVFISDFKFLIEKIDEEEIILKKAQKKKPLRPTFKLNKPIIIADTAFIIKKITKKRVGLKLVKSRDQLVELGVLKKQKPRVLPQEQIMACATEILRQLKLEFSFYYMLVVEEDGSVNWQKNYKDYIENNGYPKSIPGIEQLALILLKVESVKDYTKYELLINMSLIIYEASKMCHDQGESSGLIII